MRAMLGRFAATVDFHGVDRARGREGERGREKERDLDRESDIERERETERGRQGDRNSDTERAERARARAHGNRMQGDLCVSESERDEVRYIRYLRDRLDVDWLLSEGDKVRYIR